VRRKRTTVLVVVAALLVGTVDAAAHEEDEHAAVAATLVDCLATIPVAQQNVTHVATDCGFTGGHVVIEGNRLYLGSYGLGLRIYDISNPREPRRLGEYLPGLRADAPPDAAIFEGRHIAVLNGTRRTHTNPNLPQDIRTDRTEFLDVTDPARPVVLATFGPDQVDGESHNGDIVDARRLWLPSGGVGIQGLRIYDLNPLLGAQPAQPANLVRANPVTLWESSPYRRGRPVGAPFTHTHDIEVYTDYEVAGLGPRDIALLAEGGNYAGNGNTGSLFVLDITDPRNPVVLLRWLHETRPGHHPIRYHHEAQFLDGDDHVLLVTDEDLHSQCDAGGVTALRLSDDLTDATELSEWFIGLGTPAPVCSVHVFSSEGNLAFFGSYNAGLQVVDYGDPARPRKVGQYIAPGATSWGALYHREGIVYVGDMSRGLDVFEWHGPEPDLAVSPDDITFSTQKVVGGDRVTITGRVRNVGEVSASGVTVRISLDGGTLAEGVVDVPAGGSATVSAVWDTKQQDGEHTITVAADPANELDEADEGNNAASRTVLVRGNKVRNGSFESSGGSPPGWSSSGPTSHSDGSASSAGGSWTSDPISVAAGRSYGVDVLSSGSAGLVVVEQLGSGGIVVASATQPLASALVPVRTASSLVAAPNVTAVRITLVGGVLGTTFDEVRLWDE
jgi:hypothetical protein